MMAKTRRKLHSASFNEDNAAERLKFVKKWAEYVRTHDDKDWSSQQNLLIDSGLKDNRMTKEQYLAFKDKGKSYKKS